MSKKNQDEPLAEPESEGIWISALDALQMLSPLMPSELAKTTIIDRANAGLIASRAQNCILIPRRGHSSNLQNHDLPHFFWYQKIGKAQLSQNWQVGDFKQIHGRVRYEAFGVSFRRSDIMVLTSSRTASGDHSEKLTALDEKKAIEILVPLLVEDPDMTRDRAKEMLSDTGVKMSGKGFQHRVWSAARTRAGLPPLAAPGRKKKRDR